MKIVSLYDIDRAFTINWKKFSVFNGKISAFNNKNGKRHDAANDLKKISIQRKSKNGKVRYSTVRFGTVRYGYGDNFGRYTVKMFNNAFKIKIGFYFSFVYLVI